MEACIKQASIIFAAVLNNKIVIGNIIHRSDSQVKWVPQDVEMYLKAKEFVDTAVIPLIPLSFGDDMKQAAAMSEFTVLTASFLERQFAGRMLLLPSFTYLTTDDHEKRLKNLQAWICALKNNQMSHIFFLTSDSEWKMLEEEIKETLIWFPVLLLENLEYSQKLTIIESQATQILTLFTGKWQKSENS